MLKIETTYACGERGRGIWILCISPPFFSELKTALKNKGN